MQKELLQGLLDVVMEKFNQLLNNEPEYTKELFRSGIKIGYNAGYKAGILFCREEQNNTV